MVHLKYRTILSDSGSFQKFDLLYKIKVTSHTYVNAQADYFVSDWHLEIPQHESTFIPYLNLTLTQVTNTTECHTECSGD